MDRSRIIAITIGVVGGAYAGLYNSHKVSTTNLFHLQGVTVEEICVKYLPLSIPSFFMEEDCTFEYDLTPEEEENEIYNY
jgi:hypothetical protein